MRGQDIKSSWNSPAIRVLSEDPFKDWWLGSSNTYNESMSGGVKSSGNSVVGGRYYYVESMSGGVKASGIAVVAARYTFPVRHLANSCTVTKGTTTDGVTTTWANDSNYHQVKEVTGVDALDYHFEFSNIPAYTRSLTAIAQYRGNVAHLCYLQAYNYVTSTYDDLVRLPSGTTWVTYNFTLTDNQVSSGNARIRVYHSSAGNVNHWVGIEEMFIYERVGCNLNGSADVEFVQDSFTYSEAMSGGLRLNGSAYRTDRYTQVMSGGAKLSGSPITSLIHTQSVGGGAKASGIAPLTRLLYEPVSGGIKSAGEVQRFYRYNPVASGGILAVGVDPNKQLITVRPDRDIYTGTKFSTSPPFYTILADENSGTAVQITLNDRQSDYFIVGYYSPVVPTSVQYKVFLSSYMTVTVDLMQGSTLIAEWKHSAAGLWTFTKTLTSDEMAAITDPAELRIKVICASTNASRSAAFYWIKSVVEATAYEMADVQFFYNPAVSGGVKSKGTMTILGIGAHVLRAYTYTEPLLNTNIGQIIQRLENKTELELRVTAALHVQ